MTKLKLTVAGLLFSATILTILYCSLQWANRIEQDYKIRREIEQHHAVEVSG